VSLHHKDKPLEAIDTPGDINYIDSAESDSVLSPIGTLANLFNFETLFHFKVAM
jgi:hypothetical protein